MENSITLSGVPTTEDLTDELRQTRLALANAYERFNFVSDAELVDSCIYEINSLKAKYNYLFRKLKEQRRLESTGALGEEDVPCLAAGAMEGGSVCQS